MNDFFDFWKEQKPKIDMKKSIKLIPYLLFMLGTFLASCEHCDEGDSDNQAVYQEQNLKNSDGKVVE